MLKCGRNTHVHFHCVLVPDGERKASVQPPTTTKSSTPRVTEDSEGPDKDQQEAGVDPSHVTLSSKEAEDTEDDESSTSSSEDDGSEAAASASLEASSQVRATMALAGQDIQEDWASRRSYGCGVDPSSSHFQLKTLQRFAHVSDTGPLCTKSPRVSTSFVDAGYEDPGTPHKGLPAQMATGRAHYSLPSLPIHSARASEGLHQRLGGGG